MTKIFFLFFITETAIAIMEIQNSQKISFQAFYRHSPPCMHYLEKNFYGNRTKFNKALEILDERCSKHKFFDMFFSPSDNAIRIFPKDKSVEKYLLRGREMYLSQSEHYNQIHNLENVSEDTSKGVGISFFKILKKIFSFKKAKNIINPYTKLPANVREAVDIIEKIEHSIMQ